jgi:hypothetical protein
MRHGVVELWYRELCMLKDTILIFMLIYLESFVILEFYNNFSCINIISKITHA